MILDDVFERMTLEVTVSLQKMGGYLYFKAENT
jgi:hypothetical protein